MRLGVGVVAGLCASGIALGVAADDAATVAGTAIRRNAIAMPAAGIILGLRSASAGGSVVTIGEGFARDSVDSVYLIVRRGQQCTVDVSTTGPGGLDKGAVAARTSYALWMVNLPHGDACVASLGFDEEAAGFPAGARVRRVGSFATDGAGKVIPFRQLGTGRDREVGYKAERATLTILEEGAATVFTAVPFGHLAPVTLETVSISVVPTGGTVTVRTDSSPELLFGAPGVGMVLDGAALELEYRNGSVGGRTSIAVVGYSETL